MNGEQTLDMLCEGKSCIIKRICIDGAMRSRIRDLGMIEGTRITVLNTSFCGDPVAYYIRGAVIALRKKDTKKIYVEKC